MVPLVEVVSNFGICPLQTNPMRRPTAAMRINEFKWVQFLSLLLSNSTSQKRKPRDSNHLPSDLIHDKLYHRATVPCKTQHIFVRNQNNQLNFHL